MFSEKSGYEGKVRNRIVADSSFRVEVFVLFCFLLIGNKNSFSGRDKIKIL